VTADPTADSRFLAYLLRHNPAAVGVTLDGSGWVGVDALLAAMARHGRPLSRDALDALVAGGDKRRFELSDGRIRAAQGHSIPVDLGLEPQAPPPVLYHGTVERFLPGILAHGLRPGRRTHVHLSADVESAVTVGTRRGDPIVLLVDAAGMHRDGHAFFRAANGVWLTVHVPPQWMVPPGMGDTHPMSTHGEATRSAPDATGGEWIVWRQDDNGNRFVVARRAFRAEAEALAGEMEARGHKQTYWAAPAS
jgi:putative RNA 2'-phosphotransferase